MSATLVGCGSAVPGRPITNDELAERLDTSDEWIVKRTGIRTRHWLSPGETLADLCVEAAREAIADAGVEPREIDRILVATVTADRVTPGLAPDVARLLGCGAIATADVGAACVGFLTALDLGAAAIESGRAERVLVIGADALSRITDHDDRSTAILFGDGAGAVVLGARPAELGVSAFELGCDAERVELLYADTEERVLRMRGREVYRHAVRRMSEASAAVLARAGLEASDVDLFVAHQANARIIEATALELGVPRERLSLNVENVANTSSASIPLALAALDADGRLRPGMTIAMAAFGAGFVWGAGLTSWKDPIDAGR
ncbi:ketoacyl-ACP synthase III [Thermoleophilia bacterium SCSIO 60948]|nr:ketoacyl-ACP synthase III [Thermoleophilia bacterium SCSIO 60948]